MKWHEIPTLITQGSYEVNVSIDYFEKFFSSLEKEDGLQLNPDFQRGHVWGQSQQEKYVEYLFMGGKSGMVVYLNSPSWQRAKTTKYDDFVCVDGLQRITAIKIFLNNKIKAFGQFRDEFGDKIRRSVAVDNFKVNVNSLQTKEDVLNWYIQLNSGGTDHTKEEINRVKLLLDKETKS